MIVAYIAGPFRGPDAWTIEQNIRRAEELALECWRLGVAVICPHTNTRFFDGAASDEVWLEGDLEILRRCDVVVLTEDWERSAGARAEVEEAERNGIRAWVGAEGLRCWLDSRRETEGGEHV